MTRLTQQFVSSRPSIRDCLQLGLINYSALARAICDTYNLEQFDAVLMASRRLRERLKKRAAHEKAIIHLLKDAKIHAKTKMVVATISRSRNLEVLDSFQREVKQSGGDFTLIDGEEVTTIITNREHVPHLRSILKKRIQRLSEDLAQISMIMDPRIETTPGVVSYVYGLLYHNGVNIREEMSCWNNLMFIVEERDLARALEIVSF
ncbi:MAG: hypothetical protein KDD55_03455 [Bdellovibrionales bacterium]|nr:hypothetical protein [Bdellovibrionales bacterium]